MSNIKEKINQINQENKDKVYITSKGYQFTIINKITKVKVINGNKRWRSKYLVKFLDTGTEKWCESKEIINGSIKDDYAPYVCGIGIVGDEIDRPQSHYLYDRWRDMIRRCYDKESKSYISYGACGVVVCDEWKYFPNFVRDIETKENHKELKERHNNPSDRYEIDKDLIKEGNKIYCNEYCSIVTHQENMAERNYRNKYNKEANQKAVWRISLDFKDVKRYECITDASLDMSNKKHTSISDCVNGRCLTSLGYYWRKVEDFYSIDDAITHIMLTINSQKDIREKYRKDYVLIDLNGNIVKEFNCMCVDEVASHLNITPTHASRCIHTNNKYRNSYLLRRKESLNNVK